MIIFRKKSKFSNTKSIENNINNQKKINSNINNDMIRQSEKKEIKYIKFFKNNDESKKSNKAKKKEFNTPVKLKISDDFNLLNSNKYNEFLELSNKKKDKVITESNIKKIGNKEVKKNVYKIKK
jgi:hypothetical protein